MTLKDALLPEFDHEMGTTRKLLERIPLERRAWQPHSKSMTLDALVGHLVSLPNWVSFIIERDEFDLAESSALDGLSVESVPALLQAFDQNVAAARGRLASRTDGELLAPWTLRRSGQELFTVPKLSVFKMFLLNHLIHHRGQLSVYLRLLDVPIPSIYGPSADDDSI